jgi:acyl carrier protein phosphodiesterase
MNYLAHAVLGGLEPKVVLGNFIADAVKGRDLGAWHPEVAAGIRLHRAIDAYADGHPASGASRALLRPKLGKMAGVGLDLLHDHFLARAFGEFAAFPGGLEAFAAEVEAVLAGQIATMPPRSARFFEALRANRWLTGYADPVVMRGVCEAMDRRIPWDSDLGATLDVLANPDHERTMLRHFEAMWRDLHRHLEPLAGHSWARVPRL